MRKLEKLREDARKIKEEELRLRMLRETKGKGRKNKSKRTSFKRKGD